MNQLIQHPTIHVAGDLYINLRGGALPTESTALPGTTETLQPCVAGGISVGGLTHPVKILADGTALPATDPRTDHVAVLFPDGTFVCAYSLGRENNTKPYSTHQDAEAGAAGLTLLCRKWELATPLDALKYVVDYTRHEPAFDRNLFPGLKTNDWSWLATHSAWSKDAAGVASSAFLVNLDGGYVGDFHRYSSGFGLAVSRPGQ